jgi:hypothetical protein
MKKYTPLTNEERLELIPALSTVAQAYYDAPEEIHYNSGICYNLMHIGKVEWAYPKMGRLMRELGFNEDYFENAADKPVYSKTFEEWEERAYMCLFLSEYLMATVTEIKAPVEPTVKVKTKSIYQKAKDKVNELQENLRLYFEARDSLNSKIKGS